MPTAQRPDEPGRRRARLRNWSLGLLTLAVVAAVGIAGAIPAQATPPAATWVAKHAEPLATTDPGAPLDDLNPLEGMVGDAAVVGLGESTHGAREEFQLKHRVVRYLVEEMGFRTLAWEADWTAGLQINRYLRTGEGDLNALVQQMGTTWQSQEVADVLRWLREYNTGRDDKVQFVGVEFYATGLPAYDAVADHVAEVAPEQVPALRRHLQPIRPRTPNIGEYLAWYMGVPDKKPYVRHARQVYELVKGLPHEGDEAGYELAVHHARQILSWYEFFTLQGDPQSQYRDERAAQNLRWWRQRTGDRVAYWAASAHTANAPDLELSDPPNPVRRWDSAGSHLRRWYGEKYLSIGFTFDHGTVNVGSDEPPYGVEPIEIPRPARDWAEYPLGEVALDQFVLDLRADAPAAVRAWREAPARTRAIASFDPRRPHQYYMTGGSLTQWFDVIVHRQVVTPWEPLTSPS